MSEDSPFTRWQVVTGPPCSGKTTVINALAAHGYTTAEEVARARIKQLLAADLSLDKIRQDGLTLQRDILASKLERESALDVEQLIFFDRGVPDSIAYYRYYGLDPSEVIEKAALKRYQHIFYLEGLPLEHDDVRHESDEAAAQIGELIYQAYGDLGYSVTRVPAVSVAQRVGFILQNVPH